jgi:hypothetical protein
MPERCSRLGTSAVTVLSGQAARGDAATSVDTIRKRIVAGGRVPLAL